MFNKFCIESFSQSVSQIIRYAMDKNDVIDFAGSGYIISDNITIFIILV